MVGAGQTIDIGKMAVFEPDLLRLLIHQLEKGLLATGEAFGEVEPSLQMNFGGMSEREAFRTLELFATRVMPKFTS